MTPANRARFAHALVVGGTGMLAETSAYLARASAMVTIVARRPSVLALPLKTDAYECAVSWEVRVPIHGLATPT